MCKIINCFQCSTEGFSKKTVAPECEVKIHYFPYRNVTTVSMLSWPRLDAVQTRQAFRIMLLILVMHGIVQLIQIQRDDITADEEDHLIYGVAVLKGQVSRRVEGRDFRSTMPVTAIHALPRAV
jgi:hypothetical protein